MVSRKKAESAAIVGLVVQCAFTGLAFGIASWAGSTAVRLEGWHLLGGLGLWLVTFFHLRQKRLADEEALESEELERSRLGDRIFEETETEAGTARSGLRTFERWFVPILTVLCSAYLGFAVYSGVKKCWPVPGELSLRNQAAAAVAMVFITFLGFLIARYTSGMAEQIEWRLLRAGSSYLMGNVLASLALTIALALAHFSLNQGETVLIYVLPVLMGLIAVEYVLNLILDVYRPRVPGQEWVPPYESRLLGLFAQPQGILRTLAATLDYQFGFKVSDTWFYQFMHRAIAPLLLIQVAILWLMSCVVVIQPGERAFIERFGKPHLTKADKANGLLASEYEAGYFLKLPWPIEKARIIETTHVRMFWLGLQYKAMRSPTDQIISTIEEGDSNEDVMLWNVKHTFTDRRLEGYNLLVPSLMDAVTHKQLASLVPELADAPEQNIVRAHLPVFYTVKESGENRLDADGKQPLYQFYYSSVDAPALLKQIADRCLLVFAASVDFLEWMGSGRDEAQLALRDAIQEQADAAGIGVRVVSVGMAIVHPPTDVASDFQAVSGATQEKFTTIHIAEAEKNVSMNEAQGEAAKIVAEAEARRLEMVAMAEAKSKRFEQQMIAYGKSPEVYMQRKHLDAALKVFENRRKFIMPEASDEVLTIDFSQKLNPDLVDLSLMGGEK
ncbi:MAG TPA: hypothetical protein PL033_20725 [Candidatus Brocadiia bacterium]|nr:hypothetical protein [Candidatus Brocadiia bacterium]